MKIRLTLDYIHRRRGSNGYTYYYGFDLGLDPEERKYIKGFNQDNDKGLKMLEMPSGNLYIYGEYNAETLKMPLEKVLTRLRPVIWQAIHKHIRETREKEEIFNKDPEIELKNLKNKKLRVTNETGETKIFTVSGVTLK